MKKLLSVCLILFTSVFSVYAADEKEAAPAATPTGEYAYYGFEPEIVTNYISNRKKLGFVKISVELMVKSPDDLVTVERHDPLLRAAIVEVLGNQSEKRLSHSLAVKKSVVSASIWLIICSLKKRVKP